MKPLLGERVHYFDADDERAYAAIIVCTDVEGVGFSSPMHADLRLLIGGGEEDEDIENVPFSEVPRDGCWSWPPKANP